MCIAFYLELQAAPREHRCQLQPGAHNLDQKSFTMQGVLGKPVLFLVHGSSGGGYFFEYPQPALKAPHGIKGLFEDAGYDVYNPSLPYHDGPASAYNMMTDGSVAADDYAHSLASVRIGPTKSDAMPNSDVEPQHPWLQAGARVVLRAL